MALEDQKAQPKKITIDGQTVENRPMNEIRQAEADEAVKNMRATKKLPLRFVRFGFPGSVR